MKVGLLAFHNALNYGAVLQIAALQRAIEKLGNEAIIINYIGDGAARWDQYRKVRICRDIHRIIKWNTYLFVYKKNKREQFDNFLRGLVISPYVTEEDLLYSEEQYDYFIVGSDQVFNCFTTDSDPVYFLGFVKDKRKKNAYAASFGYEFVPDEYRDFTHEMVRDFNKISVREESGVEIIKDMIGAVVPRVIDPVFLMDVEEWELQPERIIDSEYILVYQPEKNKTLIRKAYELKKNKHMKIVLVSRTWDGTFYLNAKNMSYVSPTDFLRLIRDATYVLTDSFHGTAFCIIFRKLFLSTFNDRTSSRIENVLRIFSLSDRVFDMNTNMSIIDRYIDYSLTHEIIRSERVKAFEYLNSIDKCYKK